jgi:hypothetical protein
MWRRVDIVLTDISEERIASILREEEKIRTSASEEPAWAPHPRRLLSSPIRLFDFTTRKTTICIITPRGTGFLSLRAPTDFDTVTTTFPVIVLYVLLISMAVWTHEGDCHRYDKSTLASH